MALEIVVTTEDNNVILPDGTQILETLGTREKSLAVHLSELLDAVFKEIRENLNLSCEVEVSVSGKLSLTGEGSVNYLVFNVGGEAAAETAMTVTLKTTISTVEKK